MDSTCVREVQSGNEQVDVDGSLSRSAGNVTAQASFWAGVRHGWSKLWEDDGFPISATLHENGREVEQVLSNGERRTAAP